MHNHQIRLRDSQPYFFISYQQTITSIQKKIIYYTYQLLVIT